MIAGLSLGALHAGLSCHNGAGCEVRSWAVVVRGAWKCSGNEECCDHMLPCIFLGADETCSSDPHTGSGREQVLR